jgi:transposase
VITNLKEAPATSILERYARLWKIEESFRINKHTLSMRPIYHAKPERIKAHIALCYMAFSVLSHLEYTLMLTQKMSIDTVLDELMHIHASYYRHLPTQKRYRMPGVLTHKIM